MIQIIQINTIILHLGRRFSKSVRIRAGRSPTFQDPSTPLNGLAGTRVPINSIQQVLKSLIWTPIRESAVDSRVPGYPLPALVGILWVAIDILCYFEPKWDASSFVKKNNTGCQWQPKVFPLISKSCPPYSYQDYRSFQNMKV